MGVARLVASTSLLITAWALLKAPPSSSLVQALPVADVDVDRCYGFECCIDEDGMRRFPTELQRGFLGNDDKMDAQLVWSTLCTRPRSGSDALESFISKHPSSEKPPMNVSTKLEFIEAVKNNHVLNFMYGSTSFKENIPAGFIADSTKVVKAGVISVQLPLNIVMTKTETTELYQVDEVLPGKAEQAGIQKGDFIRAAVMRDTTGDPLLVPLDGAKTEQFQKALASNMKWYGGDDKVTLVVERVAATDTKRNSGLLRSFSFSGLLSAFSIAREAVGLPDLIADAEYVFFDVDETLVISKTPFIYGMPGSDAFVRSMMGDCQKEVEKEQWDVLQEDMEAAYYNADIALVDDELPATLHDLRFPKVGKGKLVFGLTSRPSGGDDFAVHNEKTIAALNKYGIQLSSLSEARDAAAVNGGTVDAIDKVGVETEAGGIFYADGSDKGSIISSIVPPGRSAVLVDNTYKKIAKALKSSHSEGNLRGIHWLGAADHDQGDGARQDWFCNKLRELKITCGSCQGLSNQLESWPANLWKQLPGGV